MNQGLSMLKEKSQPFIEQIKCHFFSFPPPLWKLLFYSTILQLSLAILLSHWTPIRFVCLSLLPLLSLWSQPPLYLPLSVPAASPLCFDWQHNQSLFSLGCTMCSGEWSPPHTGIRHPTASKGRGNSWQNWWAPRWASTMTTCHSVAFQDLWKSKEG